MSSELTPSDSFRAVIAASDTWRIAALTKEPKNGKATSIQLVDMYRPYFPSDSRWTLAMAIPARLPAAPVLIKEPASPVLAATDQAAVSRSILSVMKGRRSVKRDESTDEEDEIPGMAEAIARIPNAPQPGHPQYQSFVAAFRQQWAVQQSKNVRQMGRAPRGASLTDQSVLGILSRDRIRQLMLHIDPEQRLDGDVEDVWCFNSAAD